VSDIAIFVLKGDVKLQLTNSQRSTFPSRHSALAALCHHIRLLCRILVWLISAMLISASFCQPLAVNGRMSLNVCRLQRHLLTSDLSCQFSSGVCLCSGRCEREAFAESSNISRMPPTVRRLQSLRSLLLCPRV